LDRQHTAYRIDRIEAAVQPARIADIERRLALIEERLAS
jgi:hypothetical protein